MYPDRYLLFIEYFNKKKFTSAQTTLDELWLRESDVELKKFYGALVQISVSLFHLTSENAKGAKKIFEQAAAILQSMPATFQSMKTHKLVDDLIPVYSHVDDPNMTNEDYLKMIPAIEFEETFL